MVLNDQLTVQHLDHLHVRPCMTRSLNTRQQLKCAPAILHGVLSLATLRLCLKHKTVSIHICRGNTDHRLSYSVT